VKKKGDEGFQLHPPFCYTGGEELAPMKFAIPIYPIIDVQNDAQAVALSKRLEQLLNQDQIKLLLMAQGVPGIVSVTVGAPYQVADQPTPQAAVGARRR
jgi:hypothetical protein